MVPLARPPCHLALLVLLAAACGAPGDAGKPPPIDAAPSAGPDAAPSTGPEPQGSSGSPAVDPPPPPLGPGTLFHGGQVIDGTGSPRRRADVLIVEDRIAHVGVVDPDTLELLGRVDASGHIVAPGFIDSHAHGSPAATPGFPSFLAMGVTTILLGQDGSSPEAGDFAATLRRAEEAGPSVNVAWYVGHNTIRSESGVGFGAPGAAGLERMAALVEQALDAGAFGLSLGLEYTPGNQAGMEELVAIARPVAARGGVVSSHMRNEDADQVEASLAELLEQGRRSGARVHASHLKIVLGNDTTQARRMLEAMEAARAEGIQVTADLYPYTASFTGLSILFPDWARPPNDYGAVVRDRRPELAAWLRDRVESRNGPGATLFGSGPWSGRTLEEAAASAGRPFEELLIELGPGGARAAYFVMNEEVLRTFLADPHVAVASDGSPEMAHPRGYGSFPRVLRLHVAEEGQLTLEEAIRKMTSLPASIHGFDDPDRVGVPRGVLAEGWAADIVLFDPDEVRDTADFEEPHRLAEGMRGVWVNGERAWEDGPVTPRPSPGRVLRDGVRR